MLFAGTTLLFAQSGQQPGQNTSRKENTNADLLLVEARSAFSEGKLNEAADLYRKWLVENSGSKLYGSVLIEAADSQLSTEQALELLRTFTPRVSEPGQREACREYHVDLLEMLGRTEIALGLLRSFPQTQHWLYRQALLLYQHGVFEQAEKMIEEALEASHNRSEDTAAAEPASNGSGDDSPELRARLYTLLARIYSATGRSQEAEATFLFVRKRYGNASIAPVVLLAYFEFLSETGRGGEALEVLSEIEARFPDSPEYTLALGQVPSGKDTPGNDPQGQGSGAEISYAASPSRLLPKVPPPSFVPEKEETAERSDLSSRQKLSEREVSPKEIPAQEKTPEQVSPTVPGRETAAAPPADEKPPTDAKPSTAKPPAEQPAIEPPPQPVQNVLVQTGSFRDPENAQYMVRDLKASGFAARVVEKTISGNLYYRVIIGSLQSVESAQILLLKLKDKNFEGVLLFLE